MQSQLWINGAARPAAGGQSFTTPNPATGQVLAELPRATQADVEEAIAGAKRGFEAWQRVDVHERARIIWRIGDGILARLEELARLETLDTGKPLANSRAIDIPRAAETFHYFAGWADKIMGETVPVRGPYLNYTLREPLGIVAAITPWNFPILLAARKVAPALACGNAVILKPAEQSSLTSLALGPICKEAGVPDGLVQVLCGFGPEVGAALVDHPEIAKITFTGGTDTGRRIMRAAAGSLKKLSLELGGKSPNIIFADADLPAAARAAARAIFYNQGEICTAGSRLLVEESVKEQVLEHLLEATRGYKVGDPMDAGTIIGPLISEDHRDKVAGYIKKGSEEGAEMLCGGALDRPGYFVAPTIFDRVLPGMTIAKEEIFGPVLSVLSFKDLEEAVQLADATEFGLAAGVWTRDVGRAHSMARRLRAGTVWVNSYNLFDASSPYGGYKQSGFGRENGKEVLEAYTQLKSVWVATG